MELPPGRVFVQEVRGLGPIDVGSGVAPAALSVDVSLGDNPGEVWNVHWRRALAASLRWSVMSRSLASSAEEKLLSQ